MIGPPENASTSGKAELWGHSILLLLVLLGFALRVYQLDGQSMWSDEGLSLYRAQQPLAQGLTNIIRVDDIDTLDANPPLYFLLLHLWRAVAGESVFGLRFLGAAAGTLAVPLMYALGKRAFGRLVGVAVALLVAISPFHVWQSQVLRNYGLLLTLNLLSVYGLFRFVLAPWHQTSWSWLALWGLAGVLGIYTHYFGFFIFAYGVLSLMLVSLRKRGTTALLTQRRLWLGLGSCLVLMLPIVPVALSRFGAGQQVDYRHTPVTRVIAHAVGAYGVGMDPSLLQPWWRVLPAVVLLLMGIYMGWRSQRLATVLLLGYQFIPLALLMILSIINPLYNGTRHLLIGLPPFLLFVAAGSLGSLQGWKDRPGLFSIRAVRVWMGLGLSAFVFASQANWLHVQFTAPRLIRDDVRGAAEYLNDVVTARDVVVLHDTLIKFTFAHYYHGPAPVVAVPSYGDLDPGIAVASLETATQQSNRIWFLTEPTPRTGFPRQQLIEWADDNWQLVFERQFPAMWHRITLRMYDPGAVVANLRDTATPIDVTWGENLHLCGYEAPETTVSGKDWWPLFYWSQSGNQDSRYTVSLRLLDERGELWAQLNKVLDRSATAAIWRPQTLIRHHHRIRVPAGLPPGRYQVWLRLIDMTNSQAVPIASGGVEVRLLDVTVQSAACNSDEANWLPHTPLNLRIGREINLRGFSLREGEYRTGHPLSLNLFWCVRRTPRVDFRVRLQLVDAGGQVVNESINSPTRPDYPPTCWQQGELLYGRASLLVPATTEPGAYALRVAFDRTDTDEPLVVGWFRGQRSLTLDGVQVASWPLETELRPIKTALRAEFGKPTLIELHGYELLPPKATNSKNLRLTLYWRAASPVTESYRVFVHLAGTDERIVAQGDGFPAYGSRPTTSWRTGEVIEDTHIVSIGPGVLPESYRLWVGLYNPETMQRLPVFVNSDRQRNDRVLLEYVLVKP